MPTADKGQGQAQGQKAKTKAKVAVKIDFAGIEQRAIRVPLEADNLSGLLVGR